MISAVLWRGRFCEKCKGLLVYQAEHLLPGKQTEFSVRFIRLQQTQVKTPTELDKD